MISRLKFEIDPLVTEILNQFPLSIWTSDSTTFLDPSFGGGQFVREIEQRLKNAGHSDENISKRVFGIERSDFRVKIAVSKHDLLGTYSFGDFLNQDFNNMNFSAVVGNPPFQSDKGNGSQPIYRDFILKSISLLADGGCLGMISPPGFLNSSKLDTPSEVFAKLKTGNLLSVNLASVNKFFPGIGTPICYVVWQKSQYSGKTDIDGVEYDISGMSLIPRIFNSTIDSILTKLTTGNFAKLDTEYRKKDIFDTVRVAFKELNHISSKTGNIKATIININEPSDKFSFIKKCKSKREAESLVVFLNSKLVSFFNYVIRYNSVLHNGIIGKLNIPLNIMLMTDSELYAHFNLTQEEIDYIESTVK